MIPRKFSTLIGGVALTVALAAPALAQDATVEVVADGLNNPRGVKIADDGSVYVVEAGTAGDECIGEGDEAFCFGLTGAVTRVSDDGSERVLEGLPSAGMGPETGGVSDVAMTADGSMYLIMNLGADPAERAGMPEGMANAGWLMRVADDGTLEPVADVAAFESTNDPDAEMGGELDSNPYGITATDGGIAVADAGGNDVLLVGDDGSVSLLAVIAPTLHEFSAEALAAMGPPPEGEGEAPPAEGEGEAAPADGMVPIPVQAVPTSITVGPDDALYVGQLTGGPFPVGGANVYRIVAGAEPEVYASGFTNIMGLGFGPDGTLYVAEMVHDGLMTVFAGGEDGPPPVGAVLSVAPGGGEPTLVASGDRLMALGGLAVDADGAVYVSTGAIMGPGGGTLVKIDPVTTPGERPGPTRGTTARPLRRAVVLCPGVQRCRWRKLGQSERSRSGA